MTIRTCPFCGGEAEVWWELGQRKWSDRYFYKVKCCVCGVEGKAFSFFHDEPLKGSEDEWDNVAYHSAIDFWNSRAEDHGKEEK